ncbi:LytR family transcriptional regulator [Arthrobacter sp. UKPF54-2]|uniref:LytR C-terminal domain-containing protein n=1 Tax=Arthrobacter sp. UKPF54-2 TaxID=2600159 RepID=UPI0011B1C0D7|nr:LytR C-terminal domain-containing protein [Arthrobacter sp. UKPF54-2]QDY89351.1 LytR family transcriptional regulator [Arthrobacter sp. UKPF54-2]
MARTPKDPTVLHGHHVITGSELRATFVEQDELENPVRMRRRILHGVVLVLLVGLVTAAIVVALAIMNGQIKIPTTERSQAAASLCPDASFDYTPHDKINLNVYNSTSRPGLARTVADEFLARKFVVGSVGNTQSGYRGVALVVSGAAGQSAAFSVQRNLPGSDYVQDGRSDPSVDVILTGDFKDLAKPELVDQTPGKLSCPRETRRVVDDPKWPVVPTLVPPSPNP